ncbi:MAG: UDP-glucose 4-epimerase GalE [Oscillospiraceae bacterium]
MKTILVTGATGFIGSHTCVSLLENGYQVIGVDNLSNSKKECVNRIEKITGKSMVFYEADLLDMLSIDTIFSENKIDAVVHFAARKAVGESVEKPLEYYSNNIKGTLELLQVMDKNGCKNMVFSSSATVYGNHNPIPYQEHFKTDATSPYGYTKVMIEQMLTDICKADSTWSITMLRYFNPIVAHESGLIGEDPNGIPNNLVPYIAQVAVGKLKALSVFGKDYKTIDGTGVRDYVHVVDLAGGHLAALEYTLTHKGVEAINLGTGKGTSVLEIATAYGKACKKEIAIEFAPRRAGDIDEFYADTAKAKKYLNWTAQRSVNQMCEDSWRFTAMNPYGM